MADRYNPQMIKSFKNRETEKIFQGVVSHKFPFDIQTRAFNKLTALHIAESIDDLKNPPSNHLELLRGDRAGQFSIRINDKYRLCFSWIDNSAEEVEIVDYH
ncbi:plasmid maintenance system killer protein [Campylobacterota bacterium]|nr:plasmid maintenance system killer protein [Campylobacterota bacterium]